MALSNVSNKEKTVKSMLTLLDSDMYTIDKLIHYCKYTGSDNVIQFGNVLDDYQDYFESRLVEADVPEKIFYQPAAFAEMYYGTPDLDFMVLYFAKMTSLFEFTKPKIKVLPKSELLKVNKLFVNFKKSVSESYKNPKEYKKNE